MSKLNSSFTSSAHEDSDNSDCNLEIDLSATTPKRRSKIQLNDTEKKLISTFEDDTEKNIDDKATKNNLNVSNVKHLLKELVTNEHVLNLVLHADNPEQIDTSLVYEPKLTRAKARALSTDPIEWINSKKPNPETLVLLQDDLQDSSGEDYDPSDESEDEQSVASESDPPSVQSQPPTTPTKNADTQTNWSEDGIFKIPHTRTEQEELANIALRTRSKLSLSSTRLEEIEHSFIPPDITTDMYDVDCDDDDWKEFLAKFTQPIDEIAKDVDEDQDPEFNIFSEEEVIKIDKDELKEELRVDKAVKVSRKELNDLMWELFEYANFGTGDFFRDEETGQEESAQDNIQAVETVETVVVAEQPASVEVEEHSILPDQIPLLLQQMRQHVQLLTQHFLMSYSITEFSDHADKVVEYLNNLSQLGFGKERSAFHVMNLPSAIHLVNNWIQWHIGGTPDATFTRMHMNEIYDLKNRRKKVVQSFPKIFMETIANSDVFVYPDFLPSTPYRQHTKCPEKTFHFTTPENHLIAMCVEQFTEYLKVNKNRWSRLKGVAMKDVAEMISEHVILHRRPRAIYKHIYLQRKLGDDNPIGYFCKHNVLMDYQQTVLDCKPVAPKDRPMNEVPPLWRNYTNEYRMSRQKNDGSELQILSVLDGYEKPVVYTIHFPAGSNPNKPLIINTVPQPQASSETTPVQPQPPIPSSESNIDSPPSQKSNRTSTEELSKTRDNAKSPYQNTTFVSSHLTPIDKFVRCLQKPTPACRLFELFKQHGGQSSKTLKNMDMPCLTNVLQKQTAENDEIVSSTTEDQLTINMPELVPDIASSHESNSHESNDCESISNQDNLNDKIMMASATVKPRSHQNGAVKKRAKTRRDFAANLLVAAPEEPQLRSQTEERFALSYYNKLREKLCLEDYHMVMQILNDHEGDAVELFDKMEDILRPKYPQLADEFILFLREKEAATVGKLIPWILMNNYAAFARKIEVFFKDQPVQLKKVYKSLTDLSQNIDISADKIRSTMLPLLKGSPILTDLFLQSFIQNAPPTSLMDRPHENINVFKERLRPTDDEIIDNVLVPDSEDKFGGPNCICKCHQVEDPDYKTRLKHCVPCGTRFLQGRVYIQSGRELHPATVSFPTSPETDHSIRLNGKASAKLQRKSPRKQAQSPNKDGDEETEEEGDGKQKIKTGKKRKKTTQNVKKITDQQSAKSKTISTNCDQPKTEAIKERTTISRSNMPNKKAKIDNMMEASSPVEPEIKLEIDLEGAEFDIGAGCMRVKELDSESEFCEESSQDNCESDNSSSSIISSTSNAYSQSDGNAGEDTIWKREEDKLILETFKRENEKEHAFKIIAKQLPNRTVTQIRQRFQTLLNLIMEQVSIKTETS